MASIGKRTGFGTLPVFLTAISTILGAVMFLRFGYAVGSVGFLGTLVIILLGHMVTVPTAMALAEIATNQKVEGGGEYFIISRSFGVNIGAAIGVALYMSQAISVAFYVIAFAEAFDALKPWLLSEFGIIVWDNRLFSLPALALLILLMVTKGADLGMKALYVVVAILVVSLILFFMGGSSTGAEFDMGMLNATSGTDKGFFFVFAIIFPAFTGMTAGVGLSGDLHDPKRSIPFGTLSATLVGLVIYVLIALKLATSASPEDLIGDQLVMSRIALWGPIIPIGLAAATISSALGSFMVAPRTLQAIGGDDVLPNKKLNSWVFKGRGLAKEPRNATLLTSAIALVFVLMGDVNAVAEVISMFFLVTYGSLCLISFLQHFAADPAYRPSFRSKWYLSLLGAVLCIYLMMKINMPYAIAALVAMTLLYAYITLKSDTKQGMASIFQGVIQQFNRQLQVYLQKAEKATTEEEWRPAVLCLSPASFERYSALEMMRWISHRYGFGTYIHFEKAYFSKETRALAKEHLDKLIKIAAVSHSNVFLETLISPSNTAAIIQAIQQPGISGKPNNMMLFEYKRGEKEWLGDVIENYSVLKTAQFDLCILGTSDKGFGYKRSIHIWIRKEDYENANLMILMSYIILGHPDWKDGEITIYAIFREEVIEEEQRNLVELAVSGRLPISANNIHAIPLSEGSSRKDLINEVSADADLTLIGIYASMLDAEKNDEIFEGYDTVGNILFVNALTSKFIK